MSATVIYLPTIETPIATTSVAGKVKPDGTTITVDSDGTIHNQYTIPVAGRYTLGGVKIDGSTITIDSNNRISCAYRYTLPTADEYTLGGVKVDGTTIRANSAGRISAVPYTLPIASEAVLGGVRLDGVTITRDDHGVISAAVGPATSESAGTVRPDNETIVVEDGVISAVGTHGDSPYWDVRTDSDGRRRLAIVIPEG